MVLYPVIRQLLERRVVLASASPRRQDILTNAGLRFEVVPSRFKETLRKAAFPTAYAYAMETAKQKALEKDLRTPDIVIGADTVVVAEGEILEKPVDKPDAYRMLSRLNGKEHSVFTGVAIVRCSCKDGRLDADVSEFHEETRVRFSQLSEELLWEYIHSGEPLDKAGGYGIQALGAMLVEHIHGDFFNVVGFPLNRFCKELAKLYCPPRPEDVQRVKHDSIPSVDTFENLSDVESDGSSQCGARVGGGPPQPPGMKNTKDRDPNPTVESLPPMGLLQLINGFKASKALFTACKMKVFDSLRDEAPLSALEIARKIDASEHGTGQLLDVCAAFGLLEKTERGYSNTDLASLYLLSDGEYSLHGFIMRNNDLVWPLFSHLEFAMREGTHQLHRVLGTMGKHLFQDFHYGSQEKRQQFMAAMHSLINVAARQVATAFDLSQFTSACDLGGCTGTLAHELARQYPGLKVTVFDLPDVIKDAKCFQPDGPETARVSFVPGDFFRDTYPEADLYIVCRVLHDWPDNQVHQLLSRISSSCKPGGGLLVVEMLLDEEKRENQGALLQSLNMLVQTMGRERSLGEYRHLLEMHGFTDVRAVYTGSAVDVVLATRA
ncbi:probable bifunctional dTTP/UTP pyrophosphatase/methyltransferase protein isoform X2 [Pteronotus mesoamericanus]|uniref:probable bifunctional dTTP/UTP pyrophosphatase/methyltransferase protein isoform X2 n=1 Tax=Pteronotus mesoamericanus TaxID=1884717 RepID=UPI0023EBA058|nr:probable bifunctional dTTP/UTP pyrophosphatase/methyltransferase protein isoform X2 [Pteronotus parnellii mesoamericanus]